ncbi:AI-2E family transport protein [Halobacterium hubeiense]|uniref:AI-2E family transport protein n=1 Tax=Halobacterium hubeiense TaxID=1407499 RepID=A0A0U5H5C5_9EURY|nr:AI-2E family transporter [Halobacterium hubeiense]CQH62426.1 AI-2E family transport protein [Halobacterium hubeiense]
MPPSRTTTLAAVLAVLLVAAALLLGAVFGTVFFAVTVAYLLVPIHRRVQRLGLPPWWSSATTAVLASLAVLVPVSVGIYVLTDRASGLVDVLEGLPEVVTLAVYGYEYPVEVGAVTDAVLSFVAAFAVDFAVTLPELALKFTLFGMVVFGLLLAHKDAERALLATIPASYHDVARSLARRAGATLYAIYVLQAVTALATTAIALPVFLALGVPYPIMLAVVAGILQFIPIVGPSLVVGGIALYWASVGNVTGAMLVVVVAGVLVAWLPDVVVRPRLSRRTADLPGSLYFVGFTGGLLTVGPIGIIAGPLVVALVVEAASLLADEHRGAQASLLPEEWP